MFFLRKIFRYGKLFSQHFHPPQRRGKLRVCVGKLCRSLDGARAVEGLCEEKSKTFRHGKINFCAVSLCWCRFFPLFLVSLWLTSAECVFVEFSTCTTTSARGRLAKNSAILSPQPPAMFTRSAAKTSTNPHTHVRRPRKNIFSGGREGVAGGEKGRRLRERQRRGVITRLADSMALILLFGL